MRIVTVLGFASAMTIAASWASAGEMTAEERVEICDISIIQGIERYNGKPHDRDECLRDPDAYMQKIVAENQAISARIVKKKQEAREAPVKLSPEARRACRMAVTRQARFPDSVDFSFGITMKWACKGKICMKGGVSFKNSLGNMVPLTYHCEIVGDTVLKAELFPR